MGTHKQNFGDGERKWGGENVRREEGREGDELNTFFHFSFSFLFHFFHFFHFFLFFFFFILLKAAYLSLFS